jgi:hypothetical protein
LAPLGQPPWQSLPWEGEEAIAPDAEGKDIPDTSIEEVTCGDPGP